VALAKLPVHGHASGVASNARQEGRPMSDPNEKLQRNVLPIRIGREPG
jgi:hypothetical protein